MAECVRVDVGRPVCMVSRTRLGMAVGVRKRERSSLFHITQTAKPVASVDTLAPITVAPKDVPSFQYGIVVGVDSTKVSVHKYEYGEKSEVEQ
jgi:hypothetical protein